MSRVPLTPVCRRPKFAIRIAIAIAAPLIAGGCVRSDSKPASQGSVDEPAMHEDDHHTPAHKPQDLASALAALHERCSKLLKSSVSKPTDAQKELDQTRDIASWLPELAADSDLSRAEWDRINEHSKKLLQSLEELARGGSADPDPRVSQRLEIELHALDDIVGRHPELFGKGSAIERANSKDNTQYVEHPRT